jgi:hypothetical protein
MLGDTTREVLPQRLLAAVACMSRSVVALYMASSERKISNEWKKAPAGDIRSLTAVEMSFERVRVESMALFQQ